MKEILITICQERDCKRVYGCKVTHKEATINSSCDECEFICSCDIKEEPTKFKISHGICPICHPKVMEVFHQEMDIVRSVKSNLEDEECSMVWRLTSKRNMPT